MQLGLIVSIYYSSVLSNLDIKNNSSKMDLVQRDFNQSNATDHKRGYVYVATTKKMMTKNIYKIGCARDINKRIKQLNNSNFFEKYRLFYYYKCDDKFKYEKATHKLLKKYRIRNEFFNIKKDKLDSVITKTFKQLDLI